MDTLELVKEFIKAHVDNPPENITPETKLTEAGIDSLNLLELLFEAEDKYGIRFPNDLPEPQTVGELLQILEKIIAEKPAAPAAPEAPAAPANAAVESASEKART